MISEGSTTSLSLPLRPVLTDMKRDSMWHELRVVLHNRENTLLTQIVRDFARDESAFAEVVSSTWSSLAEAVENMPYE